MKIRNFTLPTIEPPINQVLTRLGYNKRKAIDDEGAVSLVRKTIGESMRLIHPVGNTMNQKIVHNDGSVTTLESGLILESVKLAKVLKPCSMATLMVCSIGMDTGEKSAELMNMDKLTEGVIYDAIGSEAIESFAEYITEVLKMQFALMGIRPTMRFSPGYGDWKTDIHKIMLPLLESENIGITCAPDSYLLKPEKSISAIIGWWSA